MHRTSAAPSCAPNACGAIVENSAASPVSTRIVRSPSRSTTVPDAEVVAVDVSEQMLEHLRHKARALGVADRIRTVQADLNQPWPALGPADLMWAAASLHHMADFTVEAERHFETALQPPLPVAAGRYAQVCLQHMRHGLDGRLCADDLATLDALATDVLGRDDLTVRTTRTVWLARRP
jgi:hypothetical protein